MPEVSIATEFGHYTISFDTDDQLNDALGRMRDHIATVDSSTEGLRPRAQREPKPGLEAFYGFTPGGQVELFTFPPQLLGAVALALHAYHPQMVTHSELEMVTGIRDVYSRVLRQANNQQYFRTRDDLFGLSHEGVAYFEERVLPDLRHGEEHSGGSEE